MWSRATLIWELQHACATILRSVASAFSNFPRIFSFLDNWRCLFSIIWSRASTAALGLPLFFRQRICSSIINTNRATTTKCDEANILFSQLPIYVFLHRKSDEPMSIRFLNQPLLINLGFWRNLPVLRHLHQPWALWHPEETWCLHHSVSRESKGAICDVEQDDQVGFWQPLESVHHFGHGYRSAGRLGEDQQSRHSIANWIEFSSTNPLVYVAQSTPYSGYDLVTLCCISFCRWLWSLPNEGCLASFWQAWDAGGTIPSDWENCLHERGFVGLAPTHCWVYGWVVSKKFLTSFWIYYSTAFYGAIGPGNAWNDNWVIRSELWVSCLSPR